MADALQNYVDGKWVDALDGDRFDVFNPATGEVIATAPSSKPADVDAAVAAARRDVRRGDVVAGDARRASAAGSCCAPPRSSVASTNGSRRLESIDSGKPLGEARDDIAEVAFMFEYYGGWATEDRRRVQHRRAPTRCSWCGRSRSAWPPASPPGTTR